MSTSSLSSGATASYKGVDDAEKGIYSGDHHITQPTRAATSPVKRERIEEAPVPAPIPTSLPAPIPAPAPPTKEAAASPAKPTPPKVSRWIEFQLWFNTYRKFFTFVVTLNGIGILLAILGKFKYANKHSGALVLGNLLCAILMRNELFQRGLYWIFIRLLRGWSPLWMRLTITSVLQHLGGIHSGCALSGAAWLIYKIVDMFRNAKVTHQAVLVMGVITNLAVCISILSAFPWVRNTHHNVFERHHRFIGWLGLAATWIFVILGNSYDPKTGSWHPSGEELIGAQEFWFAMGMTVFVLIPWFTVREVPVHIEIPSPRVAIVRFDRGMQQGLLGRISRSSIMEYHAFGIVSEGRHSPYHYMICGVQGDFTKSLVQDPPRTLWTRELKFAGVSHASAMFKRGIRICTGTGIGAALSTCMQSDKWFLIWIGASQEDQFGPTISALIHKHIPPERLILWDSKKRGGRPDTMKLIRETYHSFGAEVVFITSNLQGNTEMMQGCRREGIPAFGTLWDF